MHCVHQAIWLRRCAAMRLVATVCDENFGKHSLLSFNGAPDAPLGADPNHLVVYGVEATGVAELLTRGDGVFHGGAAIPARKTAFV